MPYSISLALVDMLGMENMMGICFFLVDRNHTLIVDCDLGFELIFVLAAYKELAL